MQIVIDIDDESYEHIKAYKNDDVLPMGWYAISHGTPLTKVDCISRQAVFDQLNQAYNLIDAEHKIKELKSVTPQPKIGKWLAKSFHEVYCDNCGFDFDIMTNEFMDKMKYCPNCGAKMESEE